MHGKRKTNKNRTANDTDNRLIRQEHQKSYNFVPYALVGGGKIEHVK